MAEKKAKAASVEGAAKPKKVELSDAEIEALIEDYLGVHPKYFVYEGLAIKVDIWNMEYDKKHFNGWKKQYES